MRRTHLEPTPQSSHYRSHTQALKSRSKDKLLSHGTCSNCSVCRIISLTLAACFCHWLDLQDLAAASSLIQKQLLVHQRVEAVEAVHPWDKHIFVVGTHHKSGSQLLRNTMAHFFNLLGATMSCQYHGQGPSVTLLNRENDCEVFPAPIRFHNHITAAAIQHMRQEASEGSADLRGVMILRDPMEMVISAYVYHHRGAEPNSPFEVGIANMGPEEMATDVLCVFHKT